MYKSPRYFLTSFDSIGLMVKMFRPDFHGSHFGFCIGTSFIIYLFYFYLQVALIFSTKFRVNWPLCSGEVVQNMFLRRQRWRPSWISDRNNFYNLLINKLSRYFLPSFEPIDFQDDGHLRFPTGTILAIFDLQAPPPPPPLVFPIKFRVSWPFSSEKFKIDFQDGHHGGHFRFPISTISAIIDL